MAEGNGSVEQEPQPNNPAHEVNPLVIGKGQQGIMHPSLSNGDDVS